MKRTQIYLPEKTLEVLKREAAEKKTTMAAVIREKVDKGIGKPNRQDIIHALKAVDELSKIRLPTMNPRKMKKILSGTPGRTYDLLSRH